MSNQTTPDAGAQELRGFMRVVSDLASVTDTFFKRLYLNLSHRHKILVDPDALRGAQAHLHAVQQRVKTQNIELARLTGVLATLDEGVVMQSPDGRIVLMNEAARDMIGSTRHFWDSPLGQLFKEYVTFERDTTFAGQVEPLGDPQRVQVNDRLLGVRLARVFSESGEFLGTVMVLRDVTSDALAERLKDSFVTQMSHELRTPLTAIKGMSDVMLNLPEGKPPNRKFLEAIGRNVAIMDRMVVELLDLSEIGGESFAVRRELVQLPNQVFNVLQGLDQRLKKADLQVTVMVTHPESALILGDEKRLLWALGHLIDNAIKYTLPGGEIVVKVGAVRDGYVLVKVEDTGVGISHHDLPHIFDRFYRGEARTPDGKVIDPRGLGQGLFVAKAVTEAHGGTLSVASMPGQGTTFIMAFPVAKYDEAA